MAAVFPLTGLPHVPTIKYCALYVHVLVWNFAEAVTITSKQEYGRQDDHF